MVAAAKPAAIVLVLYLSTVVAVVAAAVALRLRRPVSRLLKEVAKPHPERETKIPPFAVLCQGLEALKDASALGETLGGLAVGRRKVGVDLARMP